MKSGELDVTVIFNDEVDRIEVERGFSLAKRCYGLGLIHTKLDTTTWSSICLSIIAMNVDRLAVAFLYAILKLILQGSWSRCMSFIIMTNRQFVAITG